MNTSADGSLGGHVDGVHLDILEREGGEGGDVLALGDAVLPRHALQLGAQLCLGGGAGALEPAGAAVGLDGGEEQLLDRVPHVRDRRRLRHLVSSSLLGGSLLGGSLLGGSLLGSSLFGSSLFGSSLH